MSLASLSGPALLAPARPLARSGSNSNQTIPTNSQLTRSPFSALPAEVLHHILRFVRTDSDLSDPSLPAAVPFLSLASVCAAWRAPVWELAWVDLDLSAVGAAERWVQEPLVLRKLGEGRKVGVTSLAVGMEVEEEVARAVLEATNRLRHFVYTKRDPQSTELSYAILNHSALRGESVSVVAGGARAVVTVASHGFWVGPWARNSSRTSSLIRLGSFNLQNFHTSTLSLTRPDESPPSPRPTPSPSPPSPSAAGSPGLAPKTPLSTRSRP